MLDISTTTLQRDCLAIRSHSKGKLTVGPLTALHQTLITMKRVIQRVVDGETDKLLNLLTERILSPTRNPASSATPPGFTFETKMPFNKSIHM